MATSIRPVGAAGDLGWVVMAHGEDYAAEFGWDTTFEALVARIVADYASAMTERHGVERHGGEHGVERHGAWIAEHDGTRAGCVFCVPYDETTAQLRILLVRPSARGLGLGRALVDTCLDFARAQGYSAVRLWTNDVLVAARRLYLERGFTLVGAERHSSFGAELVGQTYELALPGWSASAPTRIRSP
jgi:GNAT superfamily N-acetyltransferase